MISLRHITLKQKDKTILDDFNLEIDSKERLVIVGASGSGKTTLLRLIAGFITPNKGEIYLNDTLVTKDDTILVPAQLRDVSMLFQDLALWPHMNVEDNIAFGLKMQKRDKGTQIKQVAQMLALVELEGYEKRTIASLSGGQQQRVALARALVVSPHILLMDEPLSSLDETLNQSLRQKIIDLQEKLGFTLVHVTHNKAEAKDIATKILELAS